MFSAKYCLLDLLCEFIQLVRFLEKKHSHLVTILSCVLQLQDGRIQCPVNRNTFVLKFLLTSHIDFLFIFGQFGDNCKQNLFLERTLNSGKAIATTMALTLLILLST